MRTDVEAERGPVPEHDGVRAPRALRHRVPGRDAFGRLRRMIVEVALDARKLNPKIRIILRLFDQQIAGKISEALTIDATFSSSSLAAPIVAAMSLDTKVMASYVVGGVSCVAAEIRVESSSMICGRIISEIEKSYNARVVARTLQSGVCQSPPPMDAMIVSGDTLVVHTAAAKLTALTADSKLRA